MIADQSGDSALFLEIVIAPVERALAAVLVHPDLREISADQFGIVRIQVGQDHMFAAPI